MNHADLHIGLKEVKINDSLATLAGATSFGLWVLVKAEKSNMTPKTVVCF